MNNKPKICAIICEFNPLHNGHMYTIQKARELSGCDFVMAIMSGNFTQRAEPAVLEKYKRAKLALIAGCDIVVQMPTPYATSSSEIFAASGVKIASSFKNVTHLFFGSECGDIQLLTNIASFFANEPPSYKALLKNFLKDGSSYNSARLKALEQLNKKGIISSDFTEALKSSNNILGVEYIKQLILQKSKIVPVTTKRQGEGYSSQKLSEFASATAIRQNLNNFATIKKAMPKEIFGDFKTMLEKQGIPDFNLFENLCLYSLKTASIKELKNTFDIKEGLENKFITLSRTADSLNTFIQKAASKRYKEQMIKRIILSLALKISKYDIKNIYSSQKLPLVKVLAIKKGDVLKYLQNKSLVLIRSNTSKQLSSKLAISLCQIEQTADNLYLMLTNDKSAPVPYQFGQPVFM